MTLHPDFSPPPVLTRLGPVTVLRDDLLPGGTKQRACGDFVSTALQRGKRHLIYASPFAGYAQVALAYVCGILGVDCTIYCERDQRFEADELHPFSLQAQAHGATVILVQSLAGAEERALSLSLIDSQAMKVPLGFDCEDFRAPLGERLAEVVTQVEELEGELSRIWLPVGSGTLLRTCLEALPERIRINCVNVRILASADPRIEPLKKIPRVTFYEAPMLFHEEAQDLPEIPSNVFYDAKLWSFIKEHATEGDLWWNVAR